MTRGGNRTTGRTNAVGWLAGAHWRVGAAAAGILAAVLLSLGAIASASRGPVEDPLAGVGVPTAVPSAAVSPVPALGAALAGGAASVEASTAAAAASAQVVATAASAAAAAASGVAHEVQVEAAASAAAAAAASAAAAARAPGTQSTITVPRAGSTSAPRVRLWRPQVPDSAALPVVYLLHGVPGTPDDPFDAGLGGLLDAWVAHGGAPFVVAVPDGAGDDHSDTEWADATDGTDQIETWLLTAVMPAVEGAHPRDAAHRVLAGFSMGGYGALDIALRHPGLTGTVVSLAGYIHVDDPSGVFGGDAAVAKAHEPASMLAGLRGSRVYLADGADDNEPAVSGQTQEAAKLLTALGIPATVSITPGDHSWAWAMSEWPAIEGWLAAGWGATP